MSDPNHITAQSTLAMKSFVSLVANFVVNSETHPPHVVTGFALDVNGKWFLITAQHAIIRNQDSIGLDQLLEDYPGTTISLVAYSQAPDKHSTPFRLESGRRFASEQLAEAYSNLDGDAYCQNIHRAIESSDLIAIELKKLYCDHLQVSGVVPLTVDQVILPPMCEALQLAERFNYTARMMGVPAEYVREDGNLNEAILLLLPILFVREEPPFTFWKPSWSSDRITYDVKGMSGGPLILFGGDELFVIGIQISQLREEGQRIFKAVSPEGFFQMLIAAVDHLNQSDASIADSPSVTTDAHTSTDQDD